MTSPRPLDLSVVLCSAGRPQAVRRALEAFRRQTLSPEAFEVLVVADPNDHLAREAAAACDGRPAIRLVPAPGEGIAARRNRGVSEARGRIVLFADEREVADAGLLSAHAEAHRRNPEVELAVLGRTSLSKELARDPLMHFAVEWGCFLHAYPYVNDGDVLDFRSFWPDRCSVKRELLVRHGGFDPRFRRGDDHAELGFRLTPHGFRVLHAAAARSTLVDGYAFDELCAWLRDLGASRYLFSKLHVARAVREATGVELARNLWSRVRAHGDEILRSARSLDTIVRRSMEARLPVTGEEVALLHRAYWAAFTLARAQGMAEQAAAEGEDLATAADDEGVRATAETPPVSIVIPVHGKWPHTRRCLEKLASNTTPASYETIVVDDASLDETAQELRTRFPHVRVLTNTVNTGFVGACNRGASRAQGRWILFLNNDTEPQPGWLDALLALGESSPEVGAVGSQLVFANGQLQEAGAIVFRDGSGWTYGRFSMPGMAAYQRVCEVDYRSGASLMVRRDLFERLGGFDARYAPAYYEDTDLCFGIRSLGYKVLYCPRSVVVHLEGATGGTDPSKGTKRYQVVNQRKFVAKWREELARHEPSPPASGNLPMSADRLRRLALALVDRTSPAFNPL
jgi:GT2 family glycosyltransferase